MVFYRCKFLRDRRAMKLSRLRRGSTFNNSMSEPDDTNRLNQ